VFTVNAILMTGKWMVHFKNAPDHQKMTVFPALQAHILFLKNVPKNHPVS